MTSSKTLRGRQRDVMEFGNRLNRLLEVMRPEQRRFGSETTWVPQDGQEQEAGRRAADVDIVTGKAAYAFAATGVNIAWKPSGTHPGYSQPLSPALAWRTIVDEDAMLDVTVIFTCCRQAAGFLDAQAQEAEGREASVTGKIENVAGFFRRIRGDRERGQPSQYGAVAFGGVVTGVVGLLVAYLTFTFGWVGG